MAKSAPTTIPLSALIRDPAVRRAFERAERDNGAAFAIADRPKPVLTGGAAKRMEMADA